MAAVGANVSPTFNTDNIHQHVHHNHGTAPHDIASPPSNSQHQQQQTGSSWTEPPWCGWIETTGDALIILEAARRGLIPRVTRRLVDAERKMITSGSVFVFDEDESGIKRWTDGFFWSPSRILGNFLLYRETDKRGSGHRGRANANNQADSNSGASGGLTGDLLVNEHQQYPSTATGDPSQREQSLSRPKSEIASIGIDKHRERTLVGSLTNSYKFKPDGMMKKTFSLTIGGVSQHLISYYKIEDVEQGRLRTPSSLPELVALDISPEYLDKTHFRNPPKVDYDEDGIPRYRGEADEADPPPRTHHHHHATSSTALPGPSSSAGSVSTAGGHPSIGSGSSVGTPTHPAPLSSGQPLLLDSRGGGDPSASAGDVHSHPPHDASSAGSKRASKRYDPYPGASASAPSPSGGTSKRSRKKGSGSSNQQTQSPTSETSTSSIITGPSATGGSASSGVLPASPTTMYMPHDPHAQQHAHAQQQQHHHFAPPVPQQAYPGAYYSHMYQYGVPPPHAGAPYAHTPSPTATTHAPGTPPPHPTGVPSPAPGGYAAPPAYPPPPSTGAASDPGAAGAPGPYTYYAAPPPPTAPSGYGWAHQPQAYGAYGVPGMGPGSSGMPVMGKTEEEFGGGVGVSDRQRQRQSGGGGGGAGEDA